MKKNLIYSLSNITVNTVYPLLVFPYISRVLSIESIGTYNYYNLLFTYVALFSSFGISLYASKEIGRLKDNTEKKIGLTYELLSISVFNAIISLLFIGLPIVYFSDNADFPIAILFCIMIVANSISVEWFFVAVEQQKFIFFRNIFFKVISLILIFYFVTDDSDLIKYVSIVILGLLLNALTNFIILIIKSPTRPTFRLNFTHYKGLVLIFLVEVTYRYFGMGDVAILEKYITRKELGLFTFALSVYNIISSFLKIIATTLLPRVSFFIKNENYEGMYILLKKSNSLIFFIGLPAILILFFGGHDLSVLFGGSKFYQAGDILLYFCPLLLLTSIINTLIFQFLYPLGKVKLVVLVYIVCIFINILLNIFFIPKYSYYSVIISSFISNLLAMISFLIVANKTINIKKIFSKDIGNYFVSFLFSFIVIYFINKLKLDHYNIFSIFIGLLIYLLFLYILRDRFLIGIVNTLKKKL